MRFLNKIKSLFIKKVEVIKEVPVEKHFEIIKEIEKPVEVIREIEVENQDFELVDNLVHDGGSSYTVLCLLREGQKARKPDNPDIIGTFRLFPIQSELSLNLMRMRI